MNSDIVLSNRLLQFYKNACMEQKKEHSTTHFLKGYILNTNTSKEQEDKEKSQAKLINTDAKSSIHKLVAN